MNDVFKHKKIVRKGGKKEVGKIERDFSKKEKQLAIDILEHCLDVLEDIRYITPDKQQEQRLRSVIEYLMTLLNVLKKIKPSKKGES